MCTGVRVEVVSEETANSVVIRSRSFALTMVHIGRRRGRAHSRKTERRWWRGRSEIRFVAVLRILCVRKT